MPATPDDMQNRIDRLEGLILSMMTNGAQSAGPTAAQAVINRSLSDTTSPPSHVSPDADDVIIRDMDDDEADSDLEEVADSLGMLKVDLDREKSMYIGDSHWHNVLKDVRVPLRKLTQLTVRASRSKRSRASLPYIGRSLKRATLV